ncbi:MAG: response regulator transcription factor [Alphaproteobacteria bacterium]
MGIQVHRCGLGRFSLVAALESRPSAVFVDARSDLARAVQLCVSLRAVEALARARVIAITNPGRPQERLRLYEAGADDCWVMSAENHELVERARELVRAPLRDLPRVLRCGDVVVDPDRYTVSYSGHTAKLTAMQLKLLAHLISNPGMVFSYQRLLEEVWGNPHGDERMVRACIVRLRRALTAAKGAPEIIETVRGGGYAFNPQRARQTAN